MYQFVLISAPTTCWGDVERPIAHQIIPGLITTARRARQRSKAPQKTFLMNILFFQRSHLRSVSVVSLIYINEVQVPAGVMCLTTVNGQNRAAFVDNKRNMRKCNCHASVTLIGSILSLVIILRITTKSQSSKNKSSSGCPLSCTQTFWTYDRRWPGCMGVGAYLFGEGYPPPMFQSGD